jgi:hypothetical protein
LIRELVESKEKRVLARQSAQMRQCTEATAEQIGTYLKQWGDNHADNAAEEERSFKLKFAHISTQAQQIADIVRDDEKLFLERAVQV